MKKTFKIFLNDNKVIIRNWTKLKKKSTKKLKKLKKSNKIEKLVDLENYQNRQKKIENIRNKDYNRKMYKNEKLTKLEN